MANRIDEYIKLYNGSPGELSADQFLLAPTFYNMRREFIPSISDWSTKGVSWWRAQTTR